MACITREINAKRAIHWGYVMPYKIGLVFGFSVAHLFFSVFCALSCACSSLTITAFRLSLWTLHLLLMFLPSLFCFLTVCPVAFGYTFIPRFHLFPNISGLNVSWPCPDLCGNLRVWKCQVKGIVVIEVWVGQSLQRCSLHTFTWENMDFLSEISLMQNAEQASGCECVGGRGSWCFF